MAALSYLWCNRAKFTVTSLLFYRAWTKRFLTLPELIRRNIRRSRLTSKGACIHQLAEIGDVTIGGKKNLLAIGRYSFLGKVTIALHDEVIIGERVCINDGVEILTASHDVSDPKWQHVKKKIVIEDYVWIGTGAMILPGAVLGRGSVVAARAVVSKPVERGSVVAGNPAKPLVKKRPEDLDYNPCEFIAANRAWLVG